LLYAIGEIILVVIGILIAVSLNNWNQEQKDLKAEQELLSKVLNDLETDAKSLLVNKEVINRIAEFHQDCFSIILEKKAPEEVALKNTNFVRRSLYYNPITRENHPDLINQLIDKEVKEQVATYYRWMTLMDISYGEFEEIVKQIRRTISLKEGHNLEALYGKSELAFTIDQKIILVTRENLLKLLQDKYFQQLLLESSLKLQDTTGSLDSLIVHSQALRASIKQRLDMP
jgi:hypothetical protein